MKIVLTYGEIESMCLGALHNGLAGCPFSNPDSRTTCFVARDDSGMAFEPTGLEFEFDVDKACRLEAEGDG